ncbi:hypothetical protein RHOER0001_0966 [Rhodococcus erythropolis SK121]|nr:hypothetical protein RHOER0001_0966 [Rhodococcus erythropolis SK121]
MIGITSSRGEFLLQTGGPGSLCSLRSGGARWSNERPADV